MDLADISKVANRKKMNTDAEKLREKMAHESSKIIKLRVAQDTAYWDLKERLQGVEAAHERLQQNMLDVQMQHETLSARYQEELRLRPETANKVASTREICNALEEHANRLRASLHRAAADRDALAASYADAARRVQRAHESHAHSAEAARTNITALKDRLARSEAIGARLEEIVREERRRGDQAVGEARALARNLAERNERGDALLKEKEETIATLRSEKDQLAGEARAEGERARLFIANLEKALNERDGRLATAAREAETSRADVERARLIIANLERELQERDGQIAAGIRDAEQTRAEKERACLTISNLERELQERDGRLAAAARDAEQARVEQERTKLVIANLERELHERDERLVVAARDIQVARAEGERAQLAITNFERELRNKDKQLEAAAQDTEKTRAEIVARDQRIARDYEETEILRNQAQNLEKTVAELEQKMEALSLENEELKNKIKDKDREASERAAALTTERRALEEARDEAVAGMQRAEEIMHMRGEELEKRAETIARLMRDVAAESEARARCEAALDAEQRTRAAAEDKVRTLQGQLKSKDEQLARQMTVILDTRKEKDRLQDIIGDMQSTIDNVQKELTRKQTKKSEESAARRESPEHDDNALPAPPQPLRRGESSGGSDRGVFLKPKPRADDLLYTFLSDSSTDADTLDVRAVNARFEALSRGEMTPSGGALSMMKRRRTDRRDPSRQVTADSHADDNLSLSQVKANSQERARTFFRTKRPGAKQRNDKM